MVQDLDTCHQLQIGSLQMFARASLHIFEYVSSILLSWKMVVSVFENRRPSVEFSAILEIQKLQMLNIFKDYTTIYVEN